MLTLFKTTSPKNLFPSDCITLFNEVYLIKNILFLGSERTETVDSDQEYIFILFENIEMKYKLALSIGFPTV